jgi:hypothetical protein
MGKSGTRFARGARDLTTFKGKLLTRCAILRIVVIVTVQVPGTSSLKATHQDSGRWIVIQRKRIGKKEVEAQN